MEYSYNNDDDSTITAGTDGVVVLRSGLILAKLEGLDKLRLPKRSELSGLAVISTSHTGVISSSIGCPEGCSFVPVTRLQQDLSPEISDLIADMMLNTPRK